MSTAPGPADFALTADACLERVSSWLEDFDPDEVDYTASDGVLKIEFPDGVTFVLNRQSAAQQVWFAAGARAWHYQQEPDGSCRPTTHGDDLTQCLAQAVGAKLGRQVEL
jgi:CyaY protein